MIESDIKNHYNSDNLTQKITTALTAAGKDLSSLEIKDLAPVDQLHTGGAKASFALFKKAHFSPGEQVLDAGCGIGGSSRLLAKEFNLKVAGLDLADRFIEAAVFLTRCTGLEHNATFRQGSILDLPFEDNSFDAVLCQHILMNIKDKKTAIKEFYRVLKKEGKLVLHEITRGRSSTLLLPVPWAGDAAISFLEPWDTLATQLSEYGFETAFFSEESNAACLWWEKVKAFSQKRRPSLTSLGPGLIFGDDATHFGKNMHANFENNSICLVEAVLKKRYYR